jgi:hypothetical protein
VGGDHHDVAAFYGHGGLEGAAAQVVQGWLGGVGGRVAVLHRCQPAGQRMNLDGVGEG